jgi:dienelactone hydrolase
MLASPLSAGFEKARPVRVFSRLLFLSLLALAGPALAFWGSDYDEPPPIIRLEPPSQQEVKAIGFGNQAFNEQVTRFGLAKHVPLVPDWSKAKSGKLLASWNPLAADGKHPTLVIQHGGVGGPGSTDYGHARWFLAQGFNVLVLDSFWSRGFIANWRKIDAPVSQHGPAFSALGANTRARDAFAAARWLALQPQVDAKRIFLIGGSQGGWSVLRALTDEKSITDTHRGLFRAGVSIYPACWSWQRTPHPHGVGVTRAARPALGPFYAPLFLITAELEPPGSATDIRSCDPDLLKWATRHRRLPNTTHAFDDENPPQQPANRCWYSANPHWCQASGGRDPATGNCLNAPKADFCSDLSVTGSMRADILEFLNAFQ